jgi:RNA polymerase sigma-70 factor (ECF subfamily)
MDAFRTIYDSHYATVLRFALLLTGDRERARELADDTFVRAWTARDRIRQASVRAYLLTIARNLHRDAWRQQAKGFVELDETMPDLGPSVERQVEQNACLRELRQALGRTSPGDRRALLLFAVRGLPYADVADALGISVNAVKTRISRARAVLKAAGATRPGEDIP